MFFAGVALNPNPLIDTDVPIGPDVGENEVTVSGKGRAAFTSFEYPLSFNELSIAVTRK